MINFWSTMWNPLIHSYSSCWSNVLSFSSRPAFPQLVRPTQPHPIVLSHNWGFLWGPKPIDQSRRQPRLVHLSSTTVWFNVWTGWQNPVLQSFMSWVPAWCQSDAAPGPTRQGPRRFTGTQAIGLKIGHRLHREETSQKLLRPQRNEKVHWKKECRKNEV